MGRKIVTADDLRPFLAKTGQLHLLDGSPKGRAPLAGASPSPVCPVSGTITAPDPPKGGKKRLHMNKTEHEFSLLLESWRQRGKILLWEYEALTLRWGVMSVLRYTPDFVIFDRIEVCDETPGVPRVTLRLIEVKAAFIRNRQAAVRTWKDARERWHHVFQFEFWQKTPELGWHRCDL